MAVSDDTREGDLRGELALIDLSAVHVLALRVCQSMEGYNVSEIQSALVMSWIMTTGILNDVSSMDERWGRMATMIALATRDIARSVERVMEMDVKELELARSFEGEGGKPS